MATLADAHRFPTAIAVIVANCVPIVGVEAFGWISGPGHLALFGVFMSFHLMMILALGPTPGGFFPPDIIRELFRRPWSAGIGLVVQVTGSRSW